MISVFPSVAEENTELSFMIYLSNPSVQVVVDEIISSAESVGLTVIPNYIADFNFYKFLLLTTSDWDLAYGGYMNTYPEDNIYNCAHGNMGFNYYYSRHEDTKYNEFSWDLWNMRNDALADPTIVDDDYLNDMYDKFHDCEERLWEKQIVITLASFKNIYDQFKLDLLTPNCLSGHPFSDEDLRLAFSHAIDRTIVFDYLISRGLASVSILYHVFGTSNCHDSSLPNSLPN